MTPTTTTSPTSTTTIKPTTLPTTPTSTTTPTTQTFTTTTTTTPTTTPTTQTSTTTTTTTPTPTPTTGGCTKSCKWSGWMDFGPPTTGPNGGEIVPIKRISNIYPNICSSPTEVECRAKLFPALPLSQLGQSVICNAQNGLICLNQNQGLQQQCFDYEIRVLCCETNCPTTIPTTTLGPSPTTTSGPSPTTTTTPTTTTSPTSTTTIKPTTLPTTPTSTTTTTTPTTQTSTTTTSTTPTTTPTTQTSTTTPTPTPTTGGCTKSCKWSGWMDFGPPTTGPNGGEIVPIKRISNIYPNICSSPTEVECRAKLFPALPLSQLGQSVICNAQNGLICLNQNQGLQQQCFDYEIRVLCCETNCPTIPTTTFGPSPTTTSGPSPTTTMTLTTTTSPTTTSTTTTTKPTTQTSTTTTTTTTTPTTTPTTQTSTTTTTTTPTPTPTTGGCTKSCKWSGWMDFGPPTTGPNGGEIVPIKRISNIYPNICSSPTEVECRAKLFPALPLSQLGQSVICNAQNGLICLNQNQGLQQQCFDYEIRVLCCETNCPTIPTTTFGPSPTTTSGPSPTTTMTLTTTTSPTTTSTTTTTKPTTQTSTTTTTTTTTPTTTPTTQTSTTTTTPTPTPTTGGCTKSCKWSVQLKWSAEQNSSLHCHFHS
ncbi:mucin-5AC-like [Brachyhypopomus gauderio]|uniref:mucin-5AC-like n=1 Tax=Brachyhypopomus gauderio TaxID=698409 RepID=UPI0040425FE8